VDAAADQYRAAVLGARGTSSTEYLLWAQNTSQLGLVSDPSWWANLADGLGSIPSGTLTVTDLDPPDLDPPLPAGYGFFYDGTDRVIVTDRGNRSLGIIYRLVVARGDVEYDDDGWERVGGQIDPINGNREGSPPYLVLDIDPSDQDPVSGVVRLTSAQLILLQGGLSQSRGDRVIEVVYTVAPARFWWTRNDRYGLRFGWNGKTRRWEPFKGGAPKNLGPLQFDSAYQLDPRFGNLPINAYLPGDALTPDSYAMIRLGTSPGSSSLPVAADGTFTGIRIKADADVEAGFDFSTDASVSGVLGQSNGLLVFNPAYTELHAGKTIWYVYQDFQADSNGVLGPLKNADVTPLFLAPIPGALDHPFVRIGSRRPLTPTLVETDAALESASSPGEGEVIVSLSTGRLRFSPGDIGKADPSGPLFDLQFLGASVIYDGLALNAVPQPTRAPVPLLNSSGGVASVGLGNALFIPNASYLPTTASGSDPYRGLGRSGILDAPDGTGSLPDQVGVEASVRPGGDTVGATTTGRIRQVTDGMGDAFLFSRAGALLQIVTVDNPDDLPSSSDVPRGVAYVCKQAEALGGGAVGSRVQISREDRKAARDNPLYFLQSVLTPSAYTTQARVYSKVRKVFRFNGSEVLYFAIDGVVQSWASAILIAAFPDLDFFTAEQVAASIDSVLTVGQSRAINGSVLLESLTSGSVEIGFGTGGSRDLSGAAALGFLPGWRVVEGIDNWLPDSGASYGLYRSPVNLDRSGATADFNDVDRLSGAVLQESISPNPFVFLDNVPLQDVAGYDDGVFFQFSNVIVEGETVQLVNRPLKNYQDVLYGFGDGKFNWLEQDIATTTLQQPTSTFSLGRTSIVPESMFGIPGLAGGLYAADLDSSSSGSFTLLDPDTQYVLPLAGQTGEVILIDRFGDRATFGSLGAFAADTTTFTDSGASFTTTVQPGYRLKITSGEAQGSYTVINVLSNTQLEVAPPFLFSSVRSTPWEAFRGFTSAVYDPGLVADVLYKDFNHLSSEPFVIRVLTLLGLTPPNPPSGPRLRIPSLAAIEASGRPIQIRFGLSAPTAANTASLLALSQSNQGVLANYLTLPDTARLDSGAFSVRLGTTTFTATPVTSFSPDPGGGTGIEYLTVLANTDGQLRPRGTLKFGTQLLSEYASAPVWYVETFQGAAALSSGVVEYDRETGDLNFSQADLISHVDEKVYLVEQMITTGRKDVAINPVAGSFTFNEPLQSGQSVEVEYYRANAEGRRFGDLIIEFLPVYIKNEVAIQQASPDTFLFNPANRTVDQGFEPVVYIGPVQQNFGGQPDYVLDYPPDLNGQGRLRFSRAIPSYVPVKVTYAVFEAAGGETSYDTSQRPVYRPPFFITANQNKFGLRGDRTSEFQPGQLLRIGRECFYVRGTQYFPPTLTGGDVTSVLIFPSTTLEVGSRSPGNDTLTFITEGPVTTVVDPDGPSPVPTTADAGFMQPLPIDVFPFEPVTRGQKKITFKGNLMTFAVAGHLLEVGGRPFTITQSELSEDGSRTIITVSAPFNAAVTTGSNPTVKLSYRPVYPPSVRDLIGVGPVLDSEPVELVLFGEKDQANQEKPGRTLIPDIEYRLDPDSGSIKLLEPLQAPLASDQRLLLSFTRRRVVQPFLKNGVLVEPRIHADFRYTTLPSAQNGLLGGQLAATYTFASPDSFYFRMVPLAQFLGEAAKEAQAEIKAKQPAGGAIKLGTASTNNWDRGNEGLLAQRRDLLDKDRAARTFLGFYNETVLTFEQVLETISGRLIGDQDGKFRFWVGKGKDYAPPGYEDEITGLLNPRLLWNQVFNEAAPDADIWVLESDWLVKPLTATLVDKEVEGDSPDPDFLDRLVVRQLKLVQNDVDDRILIARGPDEAGWLAPYRSKGVYARMSDPQPYSRLFPQRTRAFFFTYPGIGADPATGDPGIYTWGRMFGGEDSSTNGKPIGRLKNPVLGNIENVNTATLLNRYSRARVWGYFPNGIPANSFPGQVAPIVEPCLIATPASLSDFPLDPETGYPDPTKLLSQGGSVIDLVTGNPDLATPPFAVGQQIGWGKPDGKSYQAATNSLLSIFGTPGLEGLYVRDVQYGCVLRFANYGGTPINSPDQVLVSVTPGSGVRAEVFPIEQGDTIYVVPPVGASSYPPPGFSDPPTAEELAQLADRLPAYRTGFDVEIQADGQVIDNTWPSFSDPFFFGLKEIFGQRPPRPLSPLEGVVQFSYLKQNPLNIPALQGLDRDDAGDERIPYLATGNTELDRFDQLSTVSSEVMTAQNGALTLYVYPDEIPADDGSTVVAVTPWVGAVDREPAALMTDQDVEPNTAGHASFGEPGIGNVEGFDLLLVQVDDAATNVPLGAQGILTVGAVETRNLGGTSYGSLVEPPRFITQTTPPAGPGNSTGSPVRYFFGNAQAFTNPPYPVDPQISPPDGIYIVEDTAAGLTILDLSSVTVTLNNGLAVGTGNLNDIWAASANNIITLRLYARQDPNRAPGFDPAAGTVLLTLVIEGLNLAVTDYLGVTNNFVLTGPPVFGTHQVPFAPVDQNRQIHLPILGAIPFVGPTPTSGPIPYSVVDPGGPNQIISSLYGFEYSLSLDTWSSSGQSDTAYIAEDRLTFAEVIDFRLAKVRGYTHPANPLTDLQANLVVFEVTIGGQFSAINAVANGVGFFPSPFTFLHRSNAASVDDVGGTWTNAVALASSEIGTIRVPAFEGWFNTPIEIGGSPLSDVVFSAVPSCPDVKNGSTICLGTGTTESAYSGLPDAVQRDNRIRDVSVVSGDLGLIEKGDLLIIDQADHPTDRATTKAGTYLVRYAVEADPGQQYGQATADASAAYSGWTPTVFPSVISYNSGTGVLTVDGQWGLFGWGSRAYVVSSMSKLSSTNVMTYREGLISANILGVVPVGGVYQVTLDTTTLTYANGDSLTAVQATPFIQPGMLVSGMTSLPITVRGGNFPDDPSLVGWNDANAIYGFNQITATSPVNPAQAPVVFSATLGTLVLGTPGPALVSQLGVDPGAVAPTHLYQSDPDAVIYEDVPRTLYLALIPSDWAQLNLNVSLVIPAPVIDCFLPGTTLTAVFRAQAGIFLEPTFPRSTTNLGAAQAHVIDAGHNLPDPTPLFDFDREVGMRDFNTYSLVPSVGPEPVQFRVRRIRRFHDVNEAIQGNLLPLRYAYEIRRGRFTAEPSFDPKQFCTITASGFIMDWEATKPVGAPKAPDVWDDGDTYTGTNLGAFDNPDVNINSGDTLRVLDEYGDLVEEAEISAVLDSSQIRLAPPGLRALGSYTGVRFEVYLKQAPVPHEQSNEQLLDLITDRRVTRTFADYATNEGGYVPEIALGDTYADTANRLYDDLNASGVGGATFAALGVRRNDIVLVDPAGKIPRIGGLPAAQERGVRPIGDEGVIERTTPGVYVAGRPNQFDDNRGFYRVLSVVSTPTPHLEVTGVSTFSGDLATPVVFPEDSTQRATFGYTVYPTVHDSLLNLPSGEEGQMDLRPTEVRDPVTQSFAGHLNSMRPFSYRVIRPSNLFTQEAVDLVLTMRERMLSWIEELRGPMSGRRSGSYYVFQRDQHIDELTNPTDPEVGLGIFGNLLIRSLIGRLGIVPFANTSDALSFLDRRFWIRDQRLDTLTTDGPVSMRRVAPGDVPYTAYTDTLGGGDSVLPVLPDRVDLVLDQSDRFRALRYVWLAYRTHRILGTLAAIERFDAELPERLAEEQQALLIQASVEKVG
jgi:hypothetical protein